MPGVLHKTGAGAVHLGIGDADGLSRAAGAMRLRFPDGRLLLQHQVDRGVEAILGVVVPQPGLPLVMAGLGGVSVEADRDVAFALAPLDVPAATRLLGSLRGRARFDGSPGGPAFDLPALADALIRLSLLAAALPGVREIDVNPVSVRPAGEGAIALDARVRIASAGTPADRPAP